MNSKDGAGDKMQRLLLTYICENPEVYTQISKYIDEKDFIDPDYSQAAKYVFDSIKDGDLNPARIIGLFQDADLQKKISPLFHTKIEALDTKSEKEKAIKDVLYKVKVQSNEYHINNVGAENNSFQEMIKNKKILTEIQIMKIHLDA